MNGATRFGTRFWLSAFLGLGSGVALAQEPSGPDTRFWNQPRGNPEGTAVLPVEAVKNQPSEAWRIDFDELLAEPVSWGGVVFAAGRRGRERLLVAIQTRDGATLASAKLGSGGRLRLAVWSGTVITIDEEGLETFTYRRGSLKLKKRVKGTFPGDPCVTQGLLFLADGKQISVIDVETLKVLAAREAGGGRPAVIPDETGGLLISTYGAGAKTNYEGQYLKLYVTALRGLGTKTIELRSDRIYTGGLLHERHTRETWGYVALVEKVSRAEVKWFIDTHRPLRGPRGEVHYGDITDLDDEHISPIATPTAIWKGVAYGFSEEGELIRFHSDGATEIVVTKADLPPGARPGPATGASGVLYLGNWAVEAESGRVLWSRKDLDALTPLLPVEDGRLVYGTKTGDVVGLADSGLAAGGAASATPETGSPGLSSALRPDRLPGAILADGRVVLGATSWLPEGRVAVEAADGRKEFEASEIAFAETAARDRRRGDEYPVYAAWRSALYPEVAAMLEELARGAAGERFVREGERLLQEARTYELPAERVRALEELLSGKAENRDANAPAKLKKKAEEERAARANATQGFRQAASWCAERGLTGAATVLLARAQKLQPDEATLAQAAGLVPASFPWKGAADASARWMTWAEECLPAGAEFVPKTDPAWQGKQGAWQERAIALRTRNLLFFSLETDPNVIGTCLRKGEGTLRALEEILQLAAPGGDPERLEVQLFDGRESFLEVAKEREAEWAAGFFSPEEKLSRFYVPRGSGEDPLERELHGVMAHELVHHFLEVRWLAGEADHQLREPGFWVVEGFARFVQDQFLELGRPGRRFDDPTVSSVDLCVQIEKQDKLIPLARLILLDHEDFGQLGRDFALEVQLRYTLGKAWLSETNVFYEQAGTLAFFLMNRDEAGRKALIDYMRAYYQGELDGNGWKRLGWASLAALEADFRAFVEGLG